MEATFPAIGGTFFAEKGWNTAGTLAIDGRPGKFVASTTIGKLSPQSLAYLHAADRERIYTHQRLAIQCTQCSANVCIATSTASGKTLVFHVAAIEDLAHHPKHRIIAIYPTKALAKEQEDRWRVALEQAGIDARVGRIDGQVESSQRMGILRAANVLIMTPDIIHAWLFSHLNERDILRFLQHLSLLIVDEIHTYSGVFGSNAAFLFRRLQHVCALLQAQPRYIAASATIAGPQQHLHKLFGRDFEIIDSTHDSSPKHPVGVQLMTPPDSTDLFTAITDLLHHLVTNTDLRFITFVDSRKQVEQLSSIVARPQDDSEQEEEVFEARLDRLEKLQVLPFRAGYEEHDRDRIQERLASDSLRGVISTSALELGMDIQNLSIAVLVGVPRSATSLMQRIGRIGRHAPGHVIVINTHNVYDEAIFRHPDDFLRRPLAEGALYLENERIQYIHALCLARLGGEHDQVQIALKHEEGDFTSPIDWPPGFLTLCAKERIGEIPTDLQSIKIEGGETPEVTYPLRDVESSFRIEHKQGGHDLARLGSLSFSQVLREAYPGAVYYYVTQPYRIYRVQVNTKTIYARREKRYTTQPIALPTRIFPNFSQGSLFHNSAYGQFLVAECALQVSESLAGVKERRGRNEFNAHYPMAYDTGISFTLPYFKRSFFSTGILLTHPVFNETGVDCDLLASLIYEAFLIHVPFERQDINVAVDKHGAQRGDIPKGSRFITIYDQTYGSLRLSRRLLADNALQDTLEYALMLTEDPSTYSGNAATRKALELLCREAREVPRPLSLGDSEMSLVSDKARERIILSGSRGVDIMRNNEEFLVESVYYHPKIQGLAYRGKHITFPDPTAQEYVPLRQIAEIPDESKIGFYDYDTGEITPFTA